MWKQCWGWDGPHLERRVAPAPVIKKKGLTCECGGWGLCGSLSERHVEDADWSPKPEEETHLSLMRTSLVYEDPSTIILLKTLNWKPKTELTPPERAQVWAGGGVVLEDQLSPVGRPTSHFSLGKKQSISALFSFPRSFSFSHTPG